MERQTLVPLDGSSLAETVLPHALMLARASGSTLHLVRVVVPITMAQSYGWPVMMPTNTQTWLENDRAEAQAYLDEVAQRLRSSSIAVRTTVLEGEPTSALLAFTQENPAIRTLAMTTHGRSGVKRWLLGSVAEKLIQATPVPLLVVRASTVPLVPGHSYRSILVPLDGSSFSEQALGQAQILADWYGANLRLVSVVDPLDDVALAEGGVVPLWRIREQAAAHERAQAYLETTVQRLEYLGFTATPHLVAGAPSEGIVQASDELGVDLVVMTTHGRSGAQRLWMGSVATRVVRSSTRPVLLIRGAAESVELPKAKVEVAVVGE